MVEKDIRLSNRDGGDLWLTREGDKGWYRFCSSNDDYFLKYSRFLFDENPDSIYAFDPPGGPFLALGHIFEGYGRIKEIKGTGKGVYIKID